MKSFAFGLVCFLSVFGVAHAAPATAEETVPAFVPGTAVSGDIKIWGSPADAGLLKDWAEGFRKFNPKAEIVLSLHGPDSTLAGVYHGVANLALMGRELKLPAEHQAFIYLYLYDEFGVDVANDGVRTDRLGANPVFFVNKDNPLEHLSLGQLDGILGAEHLRGDKNIRTWGDLGLTGAWTDKPVHLYGPSVESVMALFLRTLLMKNSMKWNPDYRELPEDGKAIAAKVAMDPDGIGYGPFLAATADVKPLAVGKTDAGPFYELNTENVTQRTYPLSRVISMMLNRAPNKPVDPKVKEFLRYILSREGQAAVEKDGAYVPLNAASVQQQLKRLD